MPTAEPIPEITPRQREVLGFIARFYAESGYAVTVRQICKAF
ncbi:MAG: repressor LexA, partial [Caulobacteraceae bacterium]|nr:repressor LexA [Caulobacteraceae bacterium]